MDEEVKHKGGTATNEDNPYLKRNFDDIMDEAKQIWGKVVTEDKVQDALKILEDDFGKPTRFSEILPEQIDLLNSSLIKIKELI